MNNKYYLGIDIGGTEIKFGIVNSRAEVLEKGFIRTPKVDSLKEFLEPLVNASISLIEKAEKSLGEPIHIKGIGIGSPGMPNKKTGEITYCNSIPVLSGTKFTSELKSMINSKWANPSNNRIPIDNVQLGNDAKNASIAELNHGVLSGKKSFDLKDKNILFLTVGTGIGGTLIKNNDVLFDLAEPGHTALKDSVFENYASTSRGLIKMALEEASKNPDSLINKEWEKSKLAAKENNFPEPALDGRIFFRAYDQKDRTATKVFDAWIDNLSTGLASLVNAYEARVIVIGGGISNRENKITDPLTEQVNKKMFFSPDKTYHVEVLPAKLRNDCGIIGSAMMASHREKQLENISKMLRSKSTPNLSRTFEI